MAAKKKQQAFDPIREAAKLAPAGVAEFPTSDARAIYAMGKQGLKNLKSAESQIVSRIPQWDAAQLSRFGALLEAFLSSANDVEKAEPRSDGAFAKDSEAAWALRRVLLNSAAGAALAGVIPQAEFDRVQRGTGILDAAKDLLELARLHREHSAALAKKTFVTDAQLAHAEELGNRLTRTIKAKSAKKVTPAELAKARDLRARLFTLLSLAHDDLWSVAAFIFGKHHVDEAFPNLLARGSQRPSTKDTAKEDAPAE